MENTNISMDNDNFIPAKRIRVLLIEDDEDDYVLTDEKLADAQDISADLDWVSSYEDGLAALLRNEYDVCLLDYRLGEATGLDLLETAIEQNVKAPIILLTGQGDREIDVAAMTKGAADYLVKDRIDTSQLERSIRYALKQAEAMNQIKQYAIQLEAANTDLEAFSYSVSHDLRAPLRAISGFSHMLTDKYARQLPEDAQRYLNIVQDNTKKMGQLVDDLLEFSRASRHSLRKRQLNMSELAQQVFDDLEPEWEGRKLQFFIADLPECEGDYSLIRQVLMNLVGNAIKYSRERELAHIEVGYSDDPNYQAYFVKDNGVGFDMCYVEKIFGVFQRLHNDDEFEGTGVGLAIVQRILERHGGKVWAESTIGQGATFYFTTN